MNKSINQIELIEIRFFVYNHDLSVDFHHQKHQNNPYKFQFDYDDLNPKMVWTLKHQKVLNLIWFNHNFVGLFQLFSGFIAKFYQV